MNTPCLDCAVLDFDLTLSLPWGGIAPSARGGRLSTRGAVRTRGGAKRTPRIRLREVRTIAGVDVEFIAVFTEIGVVSLSVRSLDPENPLFAEISSADRRYLGRNAVEVAAYVEAVWIALFRRERAGLFACGRIGLNWGDEEVQNGSGTAGRERRTASADRPARIRAGSVDSQWGFYRGWLVGKPEFWLQPLLKEGSEMADEDPMVCGGNSPMLTVAEQACAVASSPVPVMLWGESGTGKELVARALHRLSSRAQFPFIAVAPNEISSGLLEAELFGCERGAYTGAYAPRSGRFELAHRGTVLLDELGDLPLEAQAKLLRVVQFGEVWRVGAKEPRKVDVRIVTATDRDLDRAVSEGSFRPQLLYRVCVVEIEVPPLRDRPMDILPLICYFSRKAQWRWSRDAFESLYAYEWPGNVRELQNFHEAVIAFLGSSEAEVGLQDLLKMPVPRNTRKSLLKIFEARMAAGGYELRIASNEGELIRPEDCEDLPGQKVAEKDLRDALLSVLDKAQARSRPFGPEDEETVRMVGEQVEKTLNAAWARLDEEELPYGGKLPGNDEPGRATEGGTWFELLMKTYENRGFVVDLLRRLVAALCVRCVDLTHERERPFYAAFERIVGVNYYDVVLGGILAAADRFGVGGLSKEERDAQNEIAKLLAALLEEAKWSLEKLPGAEGSAREIVKKRIDRKMMELGRWLEERKGDTSKLAAVPHNCLGYLTAWRDPDSAKRIIVAAVDMLDAAKVARSIQAEEHLLGSRYAVQEEFLGVSRKAVDNWKRAAMAGPFHGESS